MNDVINEIRSKSKPFVGVKTVYIHITHINQFYFIIIFVCLLFWSWTVFNRLRKENAHTGINQLLLTFSLHFNHFITYFYVLCVSEYVCGIVKQNYKWCFLTSLTFCSSTRYVWYDIKSVSVCMCMYEWKTGINMIIIQHVLKYLKNV